MIFTTATLLLSLTIYVLFTDEDSKTLTKTVKANTPELQTDKEVVDIVYNKSKKDELKKNILIQQNKSIADIQEVQLPKTKDETKEYIITQTTDHRGRFSIALTTQNELESKSLFQKRILLKGSIEDGEYKGEFLLTVPPVLLENIDLINLNITDATTHQTHSETAYCIQGIGEGYDYKINISYYGGFNCYVSEIGQAVSLPKPSKESLEKIRQIFMQQQQIQLLNTNK